MTNEATVSETKHTPTPWRVLEVDGKVFVAAKPTPDHPYYERTRFMDVVGDEDYPRKRADAERVVRCVNAHDPLVEALEEFVADCCGEALTPDAFRCSFCAAADEALALARGEKP